ncbi:zinc finger protein 836-like [Saccostrea echinata]|uniref:zinc finger protein 836-like n=1 Tax=Saccostrea echinata TaxID=191078 RepID=UPI002A80FACD|nr:zinc finger protein 836-like [Saccostrea echinata]
MHLSKKMVARKRQSVQIRGTKEASLSTNMNKETETCPVCSKEKLDVHLIESNKLMEIRGCDFCGLRYLQIKHSKSEAGTNIHCIYCYKNFNDTKNFQNHLQDHSDFLRTSSLNISSSSSSWTTNHQEASPRKRRSMTPQPREDSEGFQVKDQDNPETTIEDVAGAILTLGSSLKISNTDMRNVENWTFRSSKTARLSKTSKLSRSTSENKTSRLSRADTVLIGDCTANENQPLGRISRAASENQVTRLSRADTIVIEPQIQISDQSLCSQTGCNANKENTTRKTRSATLASGNSLDLSSFLLPDSRPTRQDSNASNSTTILSDEETLPGESSLKKDDTIVLEVSDNEGNVSSQFLMTLPTWEKMSDLDLNKLCQDVLNSKKSSVGRLASDDTIDRILPGFSMSIINLLQEDDMIIVGDQNQGKSIQIRRIPSGSSPANESNITQELPVNNEQDSLVKPQKKISKQAEEVNPGKLTGLRKNRRKGKSLRNEGPAIRKRGRHVERETHTCSVCGKVFSRRYNLKVHKYIHTEQKDLECQYCHQQFKHDSLLRNHMRIKHTRNKPFTCETCGQGFIHNNYLQRHMLLHAGDICKCCDEKFESRRQLNVHVKKVHVESNSTKHCRKCKMNFVSLLELTRHLLGMKDTV